MLIVMGLLRLGFLANFLSHPVVAGFITASGIQIATGQLAPVLGIKAHGENFVDLVTSMVPNLGQINPYTAAIGLGSLGFLFWAKGGLKPSCSASESERRPRAQWRRSARRWPWSRPPWRSGASGSMRAV